MKKFNKWLTEWGATIGIVGILLATACLIWNINQQREINRLRSYWVTD